jgi:hypothetical protein
MFWYDTTEVENWLNRSKSSTVGGSNSKNFEVLLGCMHASKGMYLLKLQQQYIHFANTT